MSFRTLLFVFAILAAALLIAAVVVLKPAMLVYVFGIFAPCAVVALLEGSGRRFVSLGGGAMTFAAAGPVILVGLLDPVRNPAADPMAWIIPLCAAGLGFLVSFVGPAIGRMIHKRSQGDQFQLLEKRQEELRAAWGDSLDDPKAEETK
ncbi:MAG: hypothetical protein JNN22_12430 [Rhodospirillales bacterium]|nr:hypothetical protein [Rhodospirillales bacterium]